MGECIATYQVQTLEAIIAPLATHLGVNFRAGRVDTGPVAARGSASKRPTSIDYSDPEAVARAKARDARILGVGSRIPGIGIEL